MVQCQMCPQKGYYYRTLSIYNLINNSSSLIHLGLWERNGSVHVPCRRKAGSLPILFLCLPFTAPFNHRFETKTSAPPPPHPPLPSSCPAPHYHFYLETGRSCTFTKTKAKQRPARNVFEKFAQGKIGTHRLLPSSALAGILGLIPW